MILIETRLGSLGKESVSPCQGIVDSIGIDSEWAYVGGAAISDLGSMEFWSAIHSY
jgi:hypothetical protein